MPRTATEWVDTTNKDFTTIEEDFSDIRRFFEGSTVFITGATGFLGRLILEKLLRTCKGVKRIYILIRQKKGKTAEERYEELFHPVVFEEVKKKDPKFLDKVIVMEGDCSLPNLGLKEQSQQILLNEVNCVFHCAATVRFNEKIRTATYINVRATRDILVLSKNMKHLKSFIYVSTAYSFCVNREIKEEFYKPAMTGDNLLALVDILADDTLERMAPILLDKWPNPYLFTKSIAEEVVKSYGNGLSCAIVRPSVVSNTIAEPVAGWIDNLYGPAGITVGTGVGLIRVCRNDSSKLADVVPGDYVINCIIAAAWNAGCKRKDTIVDVSNISEKCGNTTNIDIYNFVSSTQSPITWGQMRMYVEKYGNRMPPTTSVWFPFCFMLTSYHLYLVSTLFLHIIPAYIVDTVLYCIGKQPMMVRVYKKIHTLLDLFFNVMVKNSDFCNVNTQSLWKKLNEKDKDLFKFDMTSFPWDDYCYIFAKGLRLYILKESMDTVPQGRKKYMVFQILHYALVGVLLFGLFRFLMLFWRILL